MGGILNSVFMRCPEINDKVDSLYERREVRHYDYEIGKVVRDFKNNISDNELLKQFENLCVEIEELSSARDVVASRLCVVCGMSLHIKVQNEILAMD